MSDIIKSLEYSPVIAAIRDESMVPYALESNAEVIFLLCGNILNIKVITDKFKNAGKKVCVHIDLIEGLAKDQAAIDFLREYVNIDGCISTRAPIIRYAKQKGIFTVQRLFIIDSHSVETGKKSILETMPDAVEVLPGIIGSIIEEISNSIKIPVIAGGLIKDKNQIIEALGQGAFAISTSIKELWYE